MSFRKGVFLLAMAGLGVLADIAWAQNAPPAGAPPVNVEAPDKPANPATNAAAPAAPDVEAPDPDAAQERTAADQDHEVRIGRHHQHSGNERVMVGGNATLNEGERADTVVSVFGSSTSAGDAGDVVSVMGDTRVTGGTANDVVAVMGNVYLNGKAHGDVVASFGSIELGPEAEVGGDVVVVGGSLKRDPAAIIHGNVQNVFAIGAGSFEWLRPWARYCLLYGRPLAIAPGLGWAWGLALGFFALYVLIGFLFRGTVDRSVRTFETQPGRCIVAALLATVLTPVMLALLFVTFIGIPFVPVAAIGVFLINVFGKAVVLAWIGRSLLRLGGDGRTVHTALAVALGGIVITALYLVPFVGFLVYKAFGILGLGVAVYALIQNIKQKRGENGGPELAMAGGPAGGGSAAFREPTISDTRADAVMPRSSWDSGPSASAGASSTTSSFGFGARAESTTGASDVPGASGSAHGYGTSQSAEPAGAARASETPNGSDQAARSAPPPPPPPPPPQQPTNAAALTYPRAGFGVRMAALFIDVILVAVLLGIVESNHKAELIALATYGAVMWKLKGTTIGGVVFGLQVIRVDGRPIDWATATVRALSCFLSLVVAGLGFIWILFDEGNQAWHDKIAGTAVVRVPKGVSLL